MRTSAFAIAAGLILSSCNADSVVNGVFVVMTTAATAQPADKISRTFELSLGQVREMQIALSSLERREGSCKRGAVEERCSLAVPTCLGDIKSACIPLDVSEAISTDLAVLAPHWEFYQKQAHSVIADVTAGEGVVPPGSTQETRANFRLFDLAAKTVQVKLVPVSVRAMEALGIQVPPTIKAVLVPISD